MKAIEFEEQNVIIAKDQKEYLPLPAHVQPNGIVTFCMELSDDEYKKVKTEKRIKLAFLTFKRPLQPVRLTLVKPEFPVSYMGKFTVNPDQWTESGEAVCEFLIINPSTIAFTKQFWVSIATFGAPLQPIKLF